MQWERWQKVHLDDLLEGMTPMEFILRFTFTHPDLHTNIVGTISPSHLQHNVNVLRQGPLPADVYAEARAPPRGCGFSPTRCLARPAWSRESLGLLGPGAIEASCSPRNAPAELGQERGARSTPASSTPRTPRSAAVIAPGWRQRAWSGAGRWTVSHLDRRPRAKSCASRRDSRRGDRPSTCDRSGPAARAGRPRLCGLPVGERHLIGHDTPERRAGFLGAGIAVAALVGLILLAFAVGRFPIAPTELGRLLWSAVTGAPSDLPEAMATVVFRVRGPRILTALVVGAALSAAGAAYQGLFRNPLVSPDILGASAGAALGAVLGIYGSLGVAGIQVLAFATGLVAVGLTCAIGASLRHPDPVLVLVLAGIVIGTLFGSGVALLKYLADPYNQLPAMTFWLLGSLAGVTPADLGAILPAVVGGLVPLVLLRWRINVMTLGEEEARALGVDTRRIRLAVVAAATLMTAAVVSVSGVIGWIGLLVPHLARFLVGADFRRLLPVAMLLGGAYLLGIDTLARTLARIEIPLVCSPPLWARRSSSGSWPRHGGRRDAGDPRSRVRPCRAPHRRRCRVRRSRPAKCCASSGPTGAGRPRSSGPSSACSNRSAKASSSMARRRSDGPGDSGRGPSATCPRPSPLSSPSPC